MRLCAFVAGRVHDLRIAHDVPERSGHSSRPAAYNDAVLVPVHEVRHFLARREAPPSLLFTSFNRLQLRRACVFPVGGEVGMGTKTEAKNVYMRTIVPARTSVPPARRR